MTELNTIQFQKRWPDLHNDKVRRAIRCLPADVAVAMPDEWLDETVRRIAAGMDEVADIVRSRCVIKENPDDHTD